MTTLAFIGVGRLFPSKKRYFQGRTVYLPEGITPYNYGYPTYPLYYINVWYANDIP